MMKKIEEGVGDLQQQIQDNDSLMIYKKLQESKKFRRMMDTHFDIKVKVDTMEPIEITDTEKGQSMVQIGMKRGVTIRERNIIERFFARILIRCHEIIKKLEARHNDTTRGDSGTSCKCSGDKHMHDREGKGRDKGRLDKHKK